MSSNRSSATYTLGPTMGCYRRAAGRRRPCGARSLMSISTGGVSRRSCTKIVPLVLCKCSVCNSAWLVEYPQTFRAGQFVTIFGRGSTRQRCKRHFPCYPSLGLIQILNLCYVVSSFPVFAVSSVPIDGKTLTSTNVSLPTVACVVCLPIKFNYWITQGTSASTKYRSRGRKKRYCAKSNGREVSNYLINSHPARVPPTRRKRRSSE